MSAEEVRLGGEYPVCPDSRARLDTHVCPSCGAEAVAVQWLLPTRVARERSPELVMVERTNNMVVA